MDVRRFLRHVSILLGFALASAFGFPATARADGPSLPNDPPRNGWPAQAAPNGRLLGRDLSRLDERSLLRPGKKAALYGVTAGPDRFHAEREPLILVHGIKGAPADLQSIVDRLWSARYQIYVVCYDSLHRRTSANGIDVAEELRSLARQLGPRRDLTIVAHSLGGIVVRRALNELALGPGHGLESLGRVRFVAVDTPWHGYGGPSDRGAERFFMQIAAVFMPAGLVEMRARSALFQGEPHDADPAGTKGLCGIVLPKNVEIELVFSKEGTEVLDYDKGALRTLAPQLVDHYTRGAPVRGNAQLENYWRALLSSERYPGFTEEMRRLAEGGRLDVATARATLKTYFIEYPGDHTGILDEQPDRPSFLDHLAGELDGWWSPARRPESSAGRP